MTRRYFAFLLLLAVAYGRGLAADLEELWKERVSSVVSVEFSVDTELARQTVHTFGTVIDDKGTIIFPSAVINPKVALSQLANFKAYRAGSNIGAFMPADYLGHDEYTGWSFMRVKDAQAASSLVPITRFAAAPVPRVAQELWGVGLRKIEDGLAPYFLSGRVSLIQRLPQNTALLTKTVTGTGLPAFDHEGRFVGIGVSGFGQAYLQFSSRDRGGLPVVLIDPDECAALLLAEEVIPNLDRVPQNITGRPMVWLGTAGLQPLDPEVATYLGLGGSSGLVVTEVLEGSPAAAAGVVPRDVIVSLDGQPFPPLKPARILVDYYQREVARRRPGELLKLGLVRDGATRTVTVELKDAPPLPRELPRYYFERLGLTLRDCAYVDRVARHAPNVGKQGVIVSFIKPGGLAAAAGIVEEDWIRQINGVEIGGLDEAMGALEALDEGSGSNSCLLTVERAGQAVQLTLKTN